MPSTLPFPVYPQLARQRRAKAADLLAFWPLRNEFKERDGTVLSPRRRL
jgi:hypothetical protein